MAICMTDQTKAARRIRLGKLRIMPGYVSWCSMKDRCNNPNKQSYSYYGGKGIAYDPRWETFSEFVADMGKRPKDHTLERRDNAKGYCKENCIWLHKHLQQRNQSNTKLTMDIARYIRALYAAGSVTQKALSKKYGVTGSHGAHHMATYK